MANAKPSFTVITTKAKGERASVRIRIRKSDIRLVVDDPEGVLVILDVQHPGDQELVYLCADSFDDILGRLA